jgi:hypothetical protein
MPKLQYSVEPRFEAIADRAAKEWNSTLVNLYKLEKADFGNIIIKTGKIDTVKYPNRIAECRQFGSFWYIIMGDHVNWAISWFKRTFGFGEDALTAMIHEMGHVFDLPHASDPNYVMHPEIGGNGKLSKEEKKQYRNFILNNHE